MTERLYYTEPGRRSFDATVLACGPAGAHHAVVLDATAFYPTSGGQPFDTGRLGEARVLDVVERGDGAVVHIVDRPVEAGSRVGGEIDWPRRLDHMQQHTGQHILSAAFERLASAPTVSFHLGASESTIDLAREVGRVDVDRAEAEANRVVWENGPVTVRFVEPAEAARLPLRKEPVRAGRLRIVEVAGFDLSACGGTHVAATGTVGIIAVAAWERFKGGTRVAFVCGGRALGAHGRLRDVLAAVTKRLSVPASEVEEAVARLQAGHLTETRERRRLQDALTGYRAAALRAAGETILGRCGVLRREPGLDAAALKALAVAVVSEPGAVAVLVGTGDPAPVVVARSADVDLDAGRLVRHLTTMFGGRGGGRPELAQGGVAGEAAAVLAEARARIEAGDS